MSWATWCFFMGLLAGIIIFPLIKFIAQGVN